MARRRRDKPPAKVRKDEVAPAMRAKIGDAMWTLLDLQRCDEPRLHGNLLARKVLADFLGACRAVFHRAQTCGSDGLLPGDFDAWLARWEAALPPDELALWHHLEDERDADQHGAGPAIVAVDIPLTYMHGDANYALLGFGDQRPMISKGGIRFEAYPDEQISDVCRRAHGLVTRFADDFIAEFRL